MSEAENRLTLAVAGSRKTQGLVEACKAADASERILVLTYTSTNQQELAGRLDRLAGDHPHIEVGGWFSFLLQNFVHPFLPLMFPGRRVEGFDFDSPPQRYAPTGSWQRYFNEHGETRRRHLGQVQGRGVRRRRVILRCDGSGGQCRGGGLLFGRGVVDGA